MMSFDSHMEAAKTFLSQSLGRKRMSQNDMWRAAITLKLHQYMVLREVAFKHNVQIKVDMEELKNPSGYINRVTGEMLRIANSSPETLDSIFRIIGLLKWNSCGKRTAYSGNVFGVMRQLLADYHGHEDELERLLLAKCYGVTYYDGKIASINTKAKLYDAIRADLEK